MKSIIIFILIFVIPQLLSAQVDSGFMKCNISFANAALGIMNSDDAPAVQKKNYDKAFENWNACSKEFKAPDFTAVTISGDTFSLNKVTDKVIVMNFWSLNCPPCMAELPLLKTMAAEYKSREVVFVSLTATGITSLRSHISADIAGIPVAGDIFKLYGILAYPQTIIIKKDHFIEYQFMGVDINNMVKFKQQLTEEIKLALKE